MEVKELEELKIGLENQCLILVRQTEDSDVKLDESKEEHESWKEKIKELLVKIDGLKLKVSTLLGYYRGITNQIDIEKKKVFAIKKYFEDQSTELKEQIDIESSKLSKTKADNSDFVASLKRQQETINDDVEGLSKLQVLFDEDANNLEKRKISLDSFKDSLDKEKLRLSGLARKLGINKFIIDSNKAKSEKVLDEAKSKRTSAIRYLITIIKGRDKLILKQSAVRLLQQGLQRTKKQFINREKRLSISEVALDKRLEDFLQDATAKKLALKSESIELTRDNVNLTESNRKQSTLLGAIKLKVVSIKESYKISKSRVEKLEEIANKRSKELSAMVKLANNSLLNIAEKSGLEKEAIKILKDEQKKIQEDFKSQQEVLDTRNSELNKRQDIITANQISLKDEASTLQIWSVKNEAVEKKLDTRSTKLDSKEKKIDTTLNQATAKLKDIEKDEETTKKNLTQSASLVENNTVKRQKLKQQQEAVVNDKRELKKREQWLLNDQKKMASDRSSLRSAIYEFKRSKK